MATPDNHSDTHLGKSGEARRKESLSGGGQRASLTQDLIEWVSSLANLKGEVRKVIRNKGSAGADGMTDGMTVHDLKGWFPGNWETCRDN
jgi:hypothetical protein